jgi:hypothetical protein
MRRVAATFLMAVAFAASVGASWEAVACEQACVGDEANDACSDEVCCSCCVHARLDRPRIAEAAASTARATAFPSPDPERAVVPDPHDILHVPKARLV